VKRILLDRHGRDVTGELAEEVLAQGEHAIFGPSKIDRLMTCPGSLALGFHYENTSSAAAAEGTAGHWLHEQMLLGRPLADVAPNGVPITEEMTEAVQDSVTRVQAMHAELGGDLLVEQRVDISPWTPVPRQFGTADVIIASSTTLTVIDLKMGRGEVDVGTRQTIAYALGAFDALDWLYGFQRVIVAIHQPRLGAFEQRTLTREELLAEGEVIRTGLARCVEEDAALVPSAGGCKFCPALADCPAVAKQTADMIDATFDDLTDPVAQALAWEPIAEAFFKANRAKALATFASGGSVPGWKPVEGTTRRRWADGAEAQVAERLGSAAWEPAKLISPAQAVKLDKTLASLTEKPRGRVTLAPITDRRPEYLCADVSEAFDDTEN
jgi:Protein of unknown function (DUF2800)